MTIRLATRTTVPAPAGRNATATFFAIVARLIRNRRAARDMLELTDAQLADIGLDRGDVHYALNGSLLADPGERLRHRRR